MRNQGERLPGLVYGLMTAAAVLFGLIRAARLRWVCDDAFITFRYADNWVAGLGPVYNAGERVEGYTHFLWLCLLAAARRLGIDPVLAAEALGLAAHAATILLFAWTVRVLFRKERPVVPMTALVLALHYDGAIWATGGLETALFTLLTGLGFALLVLGPRERGGRLADSALGAFEVPANPCGGCAQSPADRCRHQGQVLRGATAS